MIKKQKLAGHGKTGGMPQTLYHDSLSTKAGIIFVYVDRDGNVAAIDFSEKPSERFEVDQTLDLKRDPEKCQNAVRQLRDYFDGKRRTFDLEYRFMFGTTFQISVWKALLEIPFGETLTYGELAKKTGKPGASRAVGNAAGKNPIPICVPCHRLVASGGKLGGYSAGIDKKIILLEHEKLFTSFSHRQKAR